MRFITAFIFSIILVQVIVLQCCHGNRINVTKVDSVTRDEVVFSAKNATTFEDIARSSAFLKTLPYLHYLCSAMLRPATKRQPPPISPAANRHLFSDIAKRQFLANANKHNYSMGVAYIRDWARKEMFGKLSYARISIIQSIMNGMCNKIYSLPEGQYLLHTHKINYAPNSTFNNQKQIATDDKDDLFSDLEIELKEMKTNADTHFRGTSLQESEGKNETEQNVTGRHLGRHLPEKVESEKLNGTIAKIPFEDISKSVAASGQDTKRRLEKSVDNTQTFRKSVPQRNLESVFRDGKSSNYSSKPYSESTSNTGDKLNGKMRQNVPNWFINRSVTELPNNTEITFKPPVIESQFKVDGDSNKNYKDEDKERDDDYQDNDEDEILGNLEKKLKNLKPGQDLSKQ